MKTDPKINQRLNAVLRDELTAINQYFLHARICKNWGLGELNEAEYHASIKAMKNADEIIERILFLEGLPNLQDLGKLLIGEDVPEILKCDLQMEMEARTVMVDTIAFLEQQKDYVSREILDDMLEDKEERIDWLEAQIDLIDKIGEQNYIQSQIGDD